MNNIRSSSNYVYILEYVICIIAILSMLHDAWAKATVWDVIGISLFCVLPMIPILKRTGHYVLTEEGITHHFLFGKVFFPWSDIKFISMTYWCTKGYSTDCAVICTQSPPRRISYRTAIAIRNRKTMMTFALGHSNSPCRNQVPTVDKEEFLTLVTRYNITVFPTFGNSR